MGAQSVQGPHQSQPGRRCCRAVLRAGRSRAQGREGGGCGPRAASAPARRAAPPALPARSLGAPEPWSPRAACSPPWWSRATSSPWPPCGSGAGGAGGRRRRKVSRRPCPGAVTSRRRRPCRREREVGRGGGRLLSPRHFLVPPLPVPSRAAARGRGEAVLPLPPTRTRRPARSLVVGGMRLALGAAWAVRERPWAGSPPGRGALRPRGTR